MGGIKEMETDDRVGLAPKLVKKVNDVQRLAWYGGHQIVIETNYPGHGYRQEQVRTFYGNGNGRTEGLSETEAVEYMKEWADWIDTGDSESMMFY